MRTTINGKPTEWPEVVSRKFDELMSERTSVRNLCDPAYTPRKVTAANYFTSRPYVDEWNRGSSGHGFVYVLDGRHVCYANLTGPDLVKREES